MKLDILPGNASDIIYDITEGKISVANNDQHGIHLVVSDTDQKHAISDEVKGYLDLAGMLT